MDSHRKYHEYFDVDEKYFPCIDDAAIDAGAPWENTRARALYLEYFFSYATICIRQYPLSLDAAFHLAVA